MVHGVRCPHIDWKVGLSTSAFLSGCRQGGAHSRTHGCAPDAQALEQVAHLDVDAVPGDPDEAVRRVVVGTVMLEPVLLTLRLLAQREVAMRRSDDGT